MSIPTTSPALVGIEDVVIVRFDAVRDGGVRLRVVTVVDVVSLLEVEFHECRVRLGGLIQPVCCAGKTFLSVNSELFVQSLGLRSPHLAAMVLPGFPAWELTLPGLPLTRVCKNEIIATDRPRHPWIPAYAGMTEWAR